MDAITIIDCGEVDYGRPGYGRVAHSTGRLLLVAPADEMAAIRAAFQSSGPSMAAGLHGRGEPRVNGDVAGPDVPQQDATGSSSTSSRVA